MFTFLHSAEAQQGHIETGRYRYGGLAARLVVDGEDYAMLSVNVRGVTLERDEFIFKTYSENEGLLESLLAAGVITVVRPIITEIGRDVVCRVLPERETAGGRNT